MIGVLRVALTFFAEKMESFIELLTTDITQYAGGVVWYGMKQLYNAMLLVGMSLAAIFIMVNLIESSYKYVETKKHVVIIRFFMEIVILYLAMSKILDILLTIYNFGAGLAKTALQSTGLMDASGELILNIALDPELDDLWVAQDWYENIASGAIIIIVSIWIVVSTVMVLLVVYGRLFNIFILISVSPLTFACALSEKTRRVFYGFLRTFISVALEAVVLVAAFYIFRVMVNGLAPAIEHGSTASVIIEHTSFIGFNFRIIDFDKNEALGILVKYLFEVSFLFALLMSIIKGCDQLVNKIFGL